MLKSTLLYAFAVIVSSVEFPKYFKPCQLSDPNINKCLVDQGNTAWNGLKRGDENYRIPRLVPDFLYLSEVTINLTTNFRINHTDVKVHSFDGMKIISADYNKTLNKFVFKLFHPDFYVTSKYDMKLKHFIGEDINGKGEVLMTFVKCEYIVEVYLTKVTKDGVEYYALEKSSFDFIPEYMILTFIGLFDGDEEKEFDGNKHINEHWRDYWKNVRVTYSTVMDKLTKLLFNAYISKIPKNEFLLA